MPSILGDLCLLLSYYDFLFASVLFRVPGDYLPPFGAEIHIQTGVGTWGAW